MKGRLRKCLVTLLAALLLVPGGFAAPASAADPAVPEEVTVFHETFADGAGVAVKSGNPAITPVDKSFDGNPDGKALYISNRANTWDGLDFPIADLGLVQGKTYNIKITGFVDEGEATNNGILALQPVDAGADNYGPWIGNVTLKSGEAFTITARHTVDKSKFPTLRLSSDGNGATVPYYIGEVIITTSNPIYEETFDKSDLSETVLIPSGNPKLALVQGVVFEGNPDGHALSVTERVYDHDAVDIPFSALNLRDGFEYSVTVAVYVDPGTTIPADASIGMQTVENDDGWVSTPLEAGKAVSFTQTFTVNSADARAIRIQTLNGGHVPFYIGSITIRQLTKGDPGEPFKPVDVAKFDFDDGTTQGWTGRGGAQANASAEQSHSGTYSLKITDRSNGWHGAQISIAGLIQPGAEYRFKAFARLADGEDPTVVRLTVQIGQDNAEYRRVTEDVPVADDNWTELKPESNFKIAEPHSVVLLYAESDDPDAAFYIDDVIITQVAPAPPQPPEDLFSQTFDFEDGTQGWRARGGGTLVEATNEAHYEGAQSLKVTNRSADWHGAELDAKNLLHAGATYEISAYVKKAADTGPSEFKITAQRQFAGEGESTDWDSIASTTVSGTDWTLLKGAYTLVKEAQSLLLYIESENSDDEYYIDYVIIKLVDAPRTVHDFESGMGDWVRRFGEDHDPNIRVTDEDNRTEGGKYSLKTTVSQEYDGPLLDLRGKLYRGHQYEFTAWVKMAAGEKPTSIRISVQYGEARFHNVTSNATVTDRDWVKLTGRYTQSTQPGDQLNVYVEVAEAISEPRTFLIDDFEMKYVRPVPGPNPDFTLPSIQEVYQDDFPVGNIMNPGDFDDETRLQMLKKHFTLLTAENAMKPEYAYKRNSKDFDLSAQESLVDEALANGFNVHGHVLVWHSQSPDWLHTKVDQNGNPVLDENNNPIPLDKEEALANLRTHVKTVVQTIGDRVISWDVVNEAIDDEKLANPDDWESTLRESGWLRAIGPDFIYEAFKAARQTIDENGWDIDLYYNDYNDDDQRKITAITNMVKALNDRYANDPDNKHNKKLIDGIGMQAHYNIHTNPENVKASIEKIIGIGVKVGITELDITDGNSDGTLTEEEAIRQGYLYARLFQLYRAYSEHITRVTFWGLDDASSWRSDGSPLLFDERFQAKPAYHAVVDPDKFIEEHPPEEKEYRQGTAAYGTPDIDGQVDAVWSRAAELPIDRYLQGSGATGTAKVLWDEENLYVLVSVQDAVLDDTASNAHEQDSVEIFVDETNSKAASYGPGVGQYRVNFKNVATFNPDSARNGFASATVTNATYTGYTVEAKIPLGIIAPRNGTKIGFDVQINDAENGARHTLVKWNDTADRGWQDPSVFGELTLTGKPGGGSSSGPPAAEAEPEQTVNDDGTVTVKPPVTVENGRAKAGIGGEHLQQALESAEADDGGRKTIILAIDAEEAAIDVELPKAGLDSDEPYVIRLQTPHGTLDLPSNMLEGIAEGAESVTIAIAKADADGLDEAVKSRIGQRPAITLNVLADGEAIAWNNPQAPVTVSIPYEPTEEERANPDHIIVLYIDGDGNATAVPNGRYDAEAGSVVFRTTHFSTYAVAYVVKSFDDLAGVPWAQGAIEAMASRDVIAGVSATRFNPSANIKRADFVALLVRALELQDTGDAVTMFSDVAESDHFYREVRIAKQLGIASGTGNNRFNPHGAITRQDMMVLAELALRAAGKSLPAEGSLDRFADAGDVSGYARASAGKLVAAGIVSGMNGKLAPHDPLTRAQAAVILYHLWSK